VVEFNRHATLFDESTPASPGSSIIFAMGNRHRAQLRAPLAAPAELPVVDLHARV
jgi:hypothetical protein